MRRISVCGAGYVGLVTAACLASLENDVLVFDIDRERIESLERGEVPFFEPGLDELTAAQVAAGRLHFSADVARVGRNRDMVFIAVATPSGANGTVDVSSIRSALDAIFASASGEILAVTKSTVPIDAVDSICQEVARRNNANIRVELVANPEFLRQGSAIADFMRPDRIVVAAESPSAIAQLSDLYAPLSAPLVVTSMRAAAMIKYASNAFLATKISFANEIAGICARAGIPASAVMPAIGADGRIGNAFLSAGLGFGGSCLPRDLDQLRAFASSIGALTPLLDAADTVNAALPERFAAALERHLGTLKNKTIAVFGIAFKGGTGDTRVSRALALVDILRARTARVRAYDPQAVYPEEYGGLAHSSAQEAADAADAVVVTADWSEFADLDWKTIARAMRGRLVLDGRSFLDSGVLESAGLHYVRA